MTNVEDIGCSLLRRSCLNLEAQQRLVKCKVECHVTQRCVSRQGVCVYGTEASPVSLESMFEGKNEWEVSGHRRVWSRVVICLLPLHSGKLETTGGCCWLLLIGMNCTGQPA